MCFIGQQQSRSIYDMVRIFFKKVLKDQIVQYLGFAFVELHSLFVFGREKEWLVMPDNKITDVEDQLVQWPLFLLANKVRDENTHFIITAVFNHSMEPSSLYRR